MPLYLEPAVGLRFQQTGGPVPADLEEEQQIHSGRRFGGKCVVRETPQQLFLELMTQ